MVIIRRADSLKVELSNLELLNFLWDNMVDTTPVKSLKTKMSELNGKNKRTRNRDRNF